MVIVGFGSVGRAVLPLILRHVAIDPAQIIIVAACAQNGDFAVHCGIRFVLAQVTKANHRHLLCPLLGPGDLLLNLALHVSSESLIILCRDLDACYCDTSIEPWPNVYRNTDLPWSERTCFALREPLRRLAGCADGPTALVGHGANPGLVSHFVKQALSELSVDILDHRAAPSTQTEWAALAEMMGIKTIHVSEYDSQATALPRSSDEFVNTWSPEGLVDEICQPSEFSWGTHERGRPSDACLTDDAQRIVLARPGGATLARSWTPDHGSYYGFLLSHLEALTIADFYTVRSAGHIRWRPSVHFVYRPCDAALASILDIAGTSWARPYQTRLLLRDIVQGGDELGVLLMGHQRKTFWFGSHLSIARARKLAPANNATTLQVAAGILGGLVWVLENPRAGLREPDDIDHRRVLQVASPYLGNLHAAYSDWTPLGGRSERFRNVTGANCPWQFINFRVDR